ncbi:MAG: ABC transporter permease [Acidobacteriota bacterium]
MPFELKIAFKYFRARRKSLARFTSVVAVVGIAAGVASLIIANALANGFNDEMQDKILTNTAHITIFTNDGSEISNWREIKKNLESSANIKEVIPTTYESALIVGKDETSYAILRVVQSSKFKVQSSIKSETISVGVKLAEKLNLESNDEAEIITLENQTQPKRSVVHIADTFQTGLYEYDSTWIYISTEDFAKIHGESNFTPTILSVSVRDIYSANKTADEIRAKLGENFKVLDWQEANQPLFAALSLERKVALAIISLIIFIAALNITTTLALLVNERRLDIAILRTCGAKTKSLIFIFLIEGLFLGLIGIFFGVIFGLLGCVLGNYFKIINISAEVYSLSFIPFRPHLPNILLIIFIAFLLCLTATVYPAFKASRIKPLENLRTQ